MRTIRFEVINQRIKPIDDLKHIYAGTNNYLKLVFNFDNNWDGCSKGISLGSKKIPMVLKDDNSCLVPSEAFDEKKLTFFLVGIKKGYRIQSCPFVIRLGG